MNKTRICSKCKVEQSIDNFYKDKSLRGGGRIYRCKTCKKFDYRKAGEKYTIAYKKKNKKYYDKNREKILQKRRKWYESNQQKVEAHWKVTNAIKKGTLQRKPCENCGKTEKIDAHHEDYSKPLDVAWLCHRCHLRRHEEIKSLPPTLG